MTDTDIHTPSPTPQRGPRLVMRVGSGSLSFSVVDRQAPEGVRHEPYALKGGVSMAANLRQAFQRSPLLRGGYTRAGVLLDTPSLLVPVELYQGEDLAALYAYCFRREASDTLIRKVLPAQNAVAVFPVNKDLKLVIEDHFQEVRYSPVCLPVWNYLLQRGETTAGAKLYAYFHDRRLDVFCFDKRRFRFSNSYAATRGEDAVYFLLYAWQLLGLDVHKDELYAVGDVPARDETLGRLRRYVRKVFLLNPAAEFNRAPITRLKDLPFDLVTYFLRK